MVGVGSGAILSNYQRTRVENVCGRLGLTSLAYLWRRPQSQLLAEMVDAGIDAVLVKVCNFGLYTRFFGVLFVMYLCCDVCVFMCDLFVF